MSQMIKSCPLSLLHLSAFSGIVSLISLVILSYDRYSTLTVYNKRGPNYRKPLLAVGGSWLYSLFWTVPPLLGWSSYGIEGAGTSCSVSWTVQTAQSHAYIICLFTFCLGIPILVMIYCYGRLLLAVKQVERHQSVCACVHVNVNVIFCERDESVFLDVIPIVIQIKKSSLNFMACAKFSPRKRQFEVFIGNRK